MAETAASFLNEFTAVSIPPMEGRPLGSSGKRARRLKAYDKAREILNAL